MYRRPLISCIVLALVLSAGALADSQSGTPPVPNPAAQQPMTRETRMLVIRSLNAEFVFVRHMLPQGTKGVAVKEGKIVSPSEGEIAQLVATYGPAAKPGDRAQITNVDIRDNKILFEINGGPKKKTKWYQHIQVSGMGGTAQVPDDATKNPHGSVVELLFPTKFVPEMTGDQIRDLLLPVFDFKAKSAAEAYLDTVPPKVKEAIKNHQVLVGMNREMVGYAKGAPTRKIREQDADGKPYEEWLYGEPPKEVEFVRFQGDEVVRLEIMKVNGEKTIRTEKEVDLKSIVAEKKEEPKPPATPGKRPSLRRPGEEPDKTAPLPPGAVPQPEPSDQSHRPATTPPQSPPPMPGQGPG
jgi:hypothetical protein